MVLFNEQFPKDSLKLDLFDYSQRWAKVRVLDQRTGAARPVSLAACNYHIRECAESLRKLRQHVNLDRSIEVCRPILENFPTENVYSTTRKNIT